MTKDNQDTLARAYAMLSALRKNISQIKDYSVEEKFVNEFHSVLDKLESVGIKTAEFRIPDSAVQPKITSRVRVGGVERKSYSEEKYVDRSFIMTKLDAILGYFEIITADKPKKIGFSISKDKA